MKLRTSPCCRCWRARPCFPFRRRNPPPGAKGKPITEVAHFDKYQVTGIAVSKTGRLFANFPHWEGDYKDAVVEVMPDGTTKPFPDGAWNSFSEKDSNTAGKWVCVQSVVWTTRTVSGCSIPATST